MVCSHYFVIVRDEKHNILSEIRVFSFSEAYYFIDDLREMFKDASSFEIICPIDSRIT